MMRLFLKTKDYSVTGEEFELMYDEKLQMLITTPKPGNLDKYYESQHYISHTDANKTFFEKLYQTVKKYSLGKKVGLIKEHSPNGNSLLDFGAGTGDFLLTAKDKGWNIEGVEPNQDARIRAREKGVGLNSNIKTIANRKFDVITLWHVLEHLPDLENQIEQLVSLLEDKGTLLIAVPNFNSFDAKHYQNFWAAYDVPRHLWHFSKKSIEKLFSNHGMKLVKTKPMLFDSFYVSLLSEKYKTGKQKYVHAFCVGLWSNIEAWRTKEHSSHIYILKRA